MPKHSSALLINESPLQALPSLACLVGINGAIILQQVHYWIQVSEHRIEGYTWIYNSYDSWAKQFKWLKPRGVQYQILELEKAGYLITRQFKYKVKSNTKWYRIDYDKLDAEYERLIDGWKSNSGGKKTNSDGEKSNSGGERSNSDDTALQQSLKLNSEQTTQETTQKTMTEDIQCIWQETLVQLKNQVSLSNYKIWLALTVPVALNNDLFLIAAERADIADYLNDNMRSLIEKVLSQVVGRQVKFKCQKGGI